VALGMLGQLYVFAHPEIRERVRGAIRAMAGNAFDDEGIEAIYDQITRNISEDDAKEFRAIDPGARIPRLGSPTASRAQLMAEASKGGVSDALLQSANVDKLLLGRIQEWARDAIQRRTFSQLAQVMTDDGAVTKMSQLAGLAPNSRRARLIAAETLHAIDLPGESQATRRTQ
jgi:hypothetical protein